MEDFLALLTTPVVSVLTFLVGLYVGHRLPLWRERRKEFNEVAERVHITLLGNGSIDASDLRLFENAIGHWNRRRFRKALAAYNAETARSQVDSFGGRSYVDPEAVQRAREHLITFTKLRK